MTRKIIYISFIRLTDKVSRDWYINYSIDRGAIVEYWDVVSLVREEHKENGALDVSYLRYIKNYKDLEKLIQNSENDDAVYVLLLSYLGKTKKIFRLLTKHDCRTVFLSWGAMPTLSRNFYSIRALRIIQQFFTNPMNFFKKISDIILTKLYRKLNLVKKFDIVFTAGSQLSALDQFAIKTIPFNLCDYDHFISVSANNDPVVKGRYAVFLDINLPFQSDLSFSGLEAVNATNYFNSLNTFFDFIETTNNLKVVIAEHPKASYKHSEFRQRESYRLLTAELVKNAEFVITHTSTALSYAVLNLKPIIFIYTSEMKRIYKNTVMKEIINTASYLDAVTYNVDEITGGIRVKIEDINPVRYDQYKYSFITSPQTEKFSSAEIFWREINAIQ